MSPNSPAFTTDTSLPAWQLAGHSSALWTALSCLASLAYLSGCGLQAWLLCNGEHGAVSTENTHSTAATDGLPQMQHHRGATMSPWATGKKTTKIHGTLVNTAVPWQSHM